MSRVILFVLMCALPSLRANADDADGRQRSEPDRPAALVAVESARAKLRTGTVRWTEKSEGAKHERRASSQFAGEDFTVVDLGDEDGVVNRDENGQPRLDLTFPGPIHWLFRKGEAWTHTERDLCATVYTGPCPPLTRFDIRGIGLASGLPPIGRGWRDTLWQFGGDFAVPAKFSSRREGTIHVVTADLGGGWKHVWYIDSERDWNPIRVLSQREGEEKPWRECRCTLRRYGDVWFPDVVRISGYKMRSVLRIESATFNRASDAPALTPADIGVEPGANIRYVPDWTAGRWTPESEEGLQWTGDRAVSRAEFKRLLKSGDVRVGPTLVAETDRLRSISSQRGRQTIQVSGTVLPAAYCPDPSAWELYVDHIAARCSFTDVQKASAHGILQDLQTRAAKLDQQGRDALFLELQKRLEQILTRSQVAALTARKTTSRPASQPTSQPEQAPRQATPPVRP